MHGGTNPGAPKGNQNARKHGGYSAKTKEAVRFLKSVANIVRHHDCEQPHPHLFDDPVNRLCQNL